MSKVNLTQKLASFDAYWTPKIVASYNCNDIMVVKVKGEFNWHSHAETDDLFLVLKGTIDIHMRDQIVTLSEGELYVIPAGIEHRPVAKQEAHLLLIEPANTPNTGDQATAAKKEMI